MRTLKEATQVTKSNVGETRQATIKASAKIFNFFSEQIYSDKYTAIWRELVANAIDAQKMNDNMTPPVVTAPSMLEPYAKVRDFGCSMDHEFMMDKFMAFTDASTKEHSDDFIGGFGIGSKAPLSYTEQYSIKCFLDGVVRVYSIFKDETGCPSIAFLSEDNTDEPDGVEVGFPVRQDDVQKFTATLVKTLQYFDPLPILEGTELELNPVEYDARGQSWGIRTADASGDRGARVIIGGVAYPLPNTSVTYEYTELRKYINMALDIYLPIGGANIALSREHVTVDADLLNKLTKLCQGIGPEYGKQISKKFENAKTLWEAKSLLNELVDSADYNMRGIYNNYAEFKGQKFVGNISKPALPLLYIAQGNYSNNYGRRSTGVYGVPTTQAMSPKFRAWLEHSRFQPHSFDLIVWDDGDTKPSLRIRTCAEENSNKRILFVRDNSPDDKPDTTLKQFLDAIGNPPSNIVKKLSEYAPAKVTRSSSGVTVARPFTCFVQSTKPYVNSTRHQQLPSDGGLYVVMNNFDPESKSADIAVAQQSGQKNTIWLNLTDYRSSGVKDNPNWYSVEEGVQKVKDEYRSKHKELPEAEGWYLANQYTYPGNIPAILTNFGDIVGLDNFPKQGPLLQILRLYEKHEEVRTSEDHEVRKNLLNVDGSKHAARILKLAEDATAKYPLIAELLNDNSMRYRASDEIKNRLF